MTPRAFDGLCPVALIVLTACARPNAGSSQAPEASASAGPVSDKTAASTASTAALSAVAPGASLMLPVGIITVGDTLTEIFPAGKPLPALFSETFATSSDGQTTVRLALGQRRAAGVEKVCDFTIEGIPPAPRTTQRAIVTVEVSATKQLTAKVRVQSTGATTTYGPFSVE